MKVAYIAGPYRAKSIYGIKKNIEAAEAVALKYWKRGCAVLCPHKNTAFFDGEAPDEVWLDGAIELMKRCDVVVMMLGWTKSEGAKAEHKIAVDMGMEIIYEGVCPECGEQSDLHDPDCPILRIKTGKKVWECSECGEQNGGHSINCPLRWRKVSVA